MLILYLLITLLALLFYAIGKLRLTIVLNLSLLISLSFQLLLNHNLLDLRVVFYIVIAIIILIVTILVAKELWL